MDSRELNARFGVDVRPYVLPVVFIAFVVGLPFGMGTAPTIFRDGDVSWHVAAGRWILQHHTIPRTDPFSFTAFGHPWIDTEWLAECVYATAFNFLGYSGLAIVVAAALIALNAIIFFYLKPRVSPAVIALALLALDLILSRFALARPHVLAWPILAGWTVLLLSGAEKGRAPPLWAVPLLTIWSNLHASFPLGLIVAGAIGLDSLIQYRWRHLREWMIFGCASAIAICVNANGLVGVLQPFRISALSMLPLIGEWRPSTLDNSKIFYALLLPGLGGLLWCRIRFPVGRLLMLLAMLGLAFAHVRHQTSFAIVAACIIPPLCKSEPLQEKLPYWALITALPFLLGRALIPLTPPENNANPWRMIGALPASLKGSPVFNEYTFGGPLILSGIKTYIDGRAEMYGDDFVENYYAIMTNDFDRFKNTATKFDIQWIVMPWTEKYMVRELSKTGDWCKIYGDPVGLVAVRKAGPFAHLCYIDTARQNN